jgi:hypothetical protein
VRGGFALWRHCANGQIEGQLVQLAVQLKDSLDVA